MLGKMFFLDNKSVVVCDGIQSVSFNTVDDFNIYYPGLDLSKKTHIDYEPDRLVYIDSVDNISIFNQPVVVSVLDDVISKVPELISKKNDPYFNITLEQAKIIRKGYIKNAFNSYLYSGFTTSIGIKFDINDGIETKIGDLSFKIEIIKK